MDFVEKALLRQFIDLLVLCQRRSGQCPGWLIAQQSSPSGRPAARTQADPYGVAPDHRLALARPHRSVDALGVFLGLASQCLWC